MSKQNFAKKRFGQNFLNDFNVIHKIVDLILANDNTTLVEIGPGRGALTLPILEQAKKLTAIELDRDLIQPLEKAAKNHGQLSILQQDALTVDFSTISDKPKSLTVFGNLPYNISTPLLFHCLKYANLINEMVFMLQKEVVKRIVAKPNSKQYGRLSIMIQYHCMAEDIFDVPPDCFTPPPKVDSAIVRLTPHEKLPYIANDYEHFSQIVNTAFSARRKTVGNALKLIISDIVFEKANIDKTLRAENLSVKQFVDLSNQDIK